MRKSNSVPVVVLGLTLGAAQACTGPGAPPPEPIHVNPPPVEPAPEPGLATNPPEPVGEAPEPEPAPGLPAWEAVPSQHPPGATNPPIPVLLVSPEGRCFKQWVGPMVPFPARRDRVEPCTEPGDCGTEVVCPAERAAPLLEQLRKDP